MSLLAVLLAGLSLQTAGDAVVEERSGATIAAAIEADDQASETPEQPAPDHPEARLYDASINASAAVDAALVRAKVRNVNVLLVLGANWCHDSRAFAGWMTMPRIGGMIAERYELLFINVGMPQTKDGHNLHIAKRFNLGELEGTPTVVVLSADGHVFNRDTAKSWRDAASRSEDDIFDELALLATAESATD